MQLCDLLTQLLALGLAHPFEPHAAFGRQLVKPHGHRMLDPLAPFNPPHFLDICVRSAHRDIVSPHHIFPANLRDPARVLAHVEGSRRSTKERVIVEWAESLFFMESDDILVWDHARVIEEPQVPLAGDADRQLRLAN